MVRRQLGQGAGALSLLDLVVCGRRDEGLGLVCTVFVLEAAGTFPTLRVLRQRILAQAAVSSNPMESFPLHGL